MPAFAANLSFLFTELDFLDRFQAAADAGFMAVEFHFPYAYEPDEIKARLKAAGQELVLFNMHPGDFDAGDRGLAAVPGRVREFRASVEQALTYALELDCPRVHCMAGVPGPEDRLEGCRAAFTSNLAYAGNMLTNEGVRLVIEPINTQDMPGYFLNDFDMAVEIIEELGEEGHPIPGLLFDIYHCAKIYSPGRVTEYLETCVDHIAHLQIADIPDRHEPGTGGLPLKQIMSAVEEEFFDLHMGLEYKPQTTTEAGLAQLKAWMKVN